MGLFGRLRRRKNAQIPYCAAVVPAAGSATRMEGQDKILTILGDYPVLVHTLRALNDSALIQEIVVVTRGDLIVPVGQICRDFAFGKVTKVIVGGDTRTASVLAGAREVSGEAELIAIHDGARPLVPPEVVDAAILRAAECGAAAPAVPVKDTVKRASGALVEATLDRDSLFAVQTPQVFQADLIRGALQKALDDGAAVTDDCAAVERIGMTVALTEGSYENIKITTPTDLLIAEAILSGRE
ncbi:2-C-methyl-D-erythritol 4-phosphate cytidylyltransferase [Pseudoflavonifractor sp. BIOML-A6]|nr:MULTISPECIES: 2-C-methyl-D-erythritol 4-phosphate cytidylyltransferase [unclassified Pseudoflavonifractor]MTQ97400.1 2-C-methyl-D-erythritol 4-phosphate cytidylyltransferase [Pseudoflavonifractor sp. BIOML-A16]MTR06430.1 2-C-methyl-D-erythritol 4-phosphate cytidylyltransferase [Pseudoflavonifractor sp. BIOML-A15]MTR31705.1 2-C-methyl-D-erythritol 4-phosphate cytidylyltransferase [Pseudoflavonifractor sp. BIOML-A14]MTR72391.1 2-C-methyl-D-erythritol 4-phosphate cytidylyltransferase [Pseudofla